MSPSWCLPGLRRKKRAPQKPHDQARPAVAIVHPEATPPPPPVRTLSQVPITMEPPLHQPNSQEARMLNLPAHKRIRLIIGLDYGTSHSGSSWALHNPGTDPRNTEITATRGWPGNRTGDYTASKVSSEIAYDQDKIYWGFDIPDDIPGPKLKWTKLLLEPEPRLKDLFTADIIHESRKQFAKMGRTEIDAASDYLACLWKHTKARIIESISQVVFDFAEKTIVLTIPAVWSPKARHNSYLVAVKAGLTAPEYSLRIVTEPEAAAITVLKNKAKILKTGDCFVVCDAGGGTVDLTSYQVENTEPLSLRECVVGDGGLCGSVFLDMAFKRFLRTLVTDEVFDKIQPRPMAKMMHEFESCIKRQFTSSEDKSYIFDLCGIPPNCDIGNEDGSIRLTRENLIPLFDSVCSDVEELIDKQIEILNKRGLSPKALLLVGGFGGNKYLRERLHEIYSSISLEIMQPQNSLEAVSTGAVLCELLGTGNVVDVHLSRINIGVKCNTIFKEGHHLQEDRFYCTYKRIYKARDQILWYIFKGDEIKTGEKTIFRFNWTSPAEYPGLNSTENIVKVVTHLVRSDEDDPSTRKTPAVHDYVTITFTIDRSIFESSPQQVGSDGNLFWNIDYDMEMTAGPAKLQFSCIINGVVRDSTDVIYHAAR